jgi:hypothetical protein
MVQVNRRLSATEPPSRRLTPPKYTAEGLENQAKVSKSGLSVQKSRTCAKGGSI